MPLVCVDPKSAGKELSLLVDPKSAGNAAALVCCELPAKASQPLAIAAGAGADPKIGRAHV